MKKGCKEFMFAAAAGLAVVSATGIPLTEVKNLVDDEVPHHEHKRHHNMRRAPPALDSSNQHDGLSPRLVQQQIEKMALRADKLATKDLASATRVQAGLETVEAALVTRVGADTSLADEINTVRAELCAHKAFRNHKEMDCEAFMQSSCYPADEDSDVPNAPKVPASFCQQYWSSQAEPVESDAADMAPAVAPAMAPAPAPGPADEQEDWQFNKKLRSLPEQGYSGDLVDHPDQDTQTSDWQQEFGPHAGHRTYRQICQDHPNNSWCKLHMQYTGNLPPGWGPRPVPEKSATSQRGAFGGFLAASLAALLGALVAA